jgi:hypothetical protein
MKLSTIYTVIIVLTFIAFAIVFNTFPRSTYSELEKRDLATFPEFSLDRLKSGAFTRDISSWFSDSEPYRDVFMALSMEIDNAMRVTLSEENITFIPPTTPASNTEEEMDMALDLMNGSIPTDEYANENAKIANAGIMVVGTGDRVRALMVYNGTSKMGGKFADAVNKYHEEFGSNINIYAMVIPTSIEFYCPTKAQKHTKPQQATIDNVYSLLNQGVKSIDVYSALKQHRNEDIYLRTDHHWAPLGAYYAAKEFASVAGVQFPNLSAYDTITVRRFVGSMYGYSKDASIKDSPEDFIYYVPKNVEYSTTYINYEVDKNYMVTGESHPYKGVYFFKYKDGNGGAYSTFMGGDQKLTTVKTSAGNGRRLMIIKDSFGNAIPGHLFYSFEEIHVVDFRYFTKNMRDYVTSSGITDILFALNVFNTCSSSVDKKILRYLTQSPGVHAEETPQSEPDALTEPDTITSSQPIEHETVPADTTNHTSAEELD